MKQLILSLKINGDPSNATKVRCNGKRIKMARVCTKGQILDMVSFNLASIVQKKCKETQECCTRYYKVTILETCFSAFFYALPYGVSFSEVPFSLVFV